MDHISDTVMSKRFKQLRNQAGFTLLELLVVVAVLAIIAGGLLVSYDGLEAKSSKGQATFNLAAVDKGIRTFKVVSGAYPTELDGLLLNNTATVTCAGTSCTAATGGFYTGLHANLQGTEGDVLTADNKLGFRALTAGEASALINAGVSNVRMIDNTLGNTVGTIPNRDFDDAPRGKGVPVNIASGVVVPVVESEGLGAADAPAGCVAPFSSACNRLNDIAGLNPAQGHVVVALGVGNNSSIVSDQGGGNSANFAEAPYYTDVAKNQYGRFLALFHVASDLNDDGDFADAGETFSSARFIGVIDSKGDWLDEEYAEFTGQKT
ncbi:MAG: prepilin-type N-terminal cleavage/methylation domain-containing protein [Candidatus Manganitrophus sp. SA1]|nr:prepilin-type N-terminal cleavage/methylation domain-containing protein [Candidatus Manganitrophus morganii]